ncbi:MAG: hypothetical protein OEM49_06315 [Myxococcales bacterium]|nr:hypothetical protein [Myxococcales bacterium]MDH5307726.1 hypothetical protein [Myxococcales bacterium]MDH5567946.1 hypothetical protein [Myxococcales bacterium]
MPSDRPDASRTAGGSRWAWLSSQGLGVLCGQATVALLAIGSVVLAATREGASAAIAVDDIRGFFAPPAAAHLWFYLLVPLLALYALNTTLATWQNVARKWRAGIRAPRFYAPVVIHAAFLIGLLAHGIGGLAGAERGRVVVGPSWTALGEGREARVTALDVETHADGSMKQVRASVETRGADGTVSASVVRYNGPLSWALGSELLLLVRPHAVPVVRLARGDARCEVEVEGSCELGGVRAELLYLHPPLRAGQGAFTRMRVAGGDTREVFSLSSGQSQMLADGSHLSIEAIEARPAIVLRHRHAPGNPWALLASILLALGLAMMWRRFGPRVGAA